MTVVIGVVTVAAVPVGVVTVAVVIGVLTVTVAAGTEIGSVGRDTVGTGRVEGDSNDNAGYSAFGRLYAIGYIRGLQQAVYAEGAA